MEKCEPHQFIECHVHHWLWLIVPAIQIAVGTSGNILNIIVLSRPKIRKFSASVYLLSLAGADIVFLWSSTFPEVIREWNGIRFENMSNLSCKVRNWMVYASAGYSVWLLVFMTAERLFLTKRPMIARAKLSPMNAGIASSVLLAACLLFSSHYLFGRHIKTQYRYGNDSDIIEVYHRCIATSDAFDIFYQFTWNLLILLVLNIIPMIIIIVGNINIVAEIIFQKRKVRRINPVSNLPKVNGNRKKSTTKMLFVVTGFFMVTTLPFTMFSVLRQNIKVQSPRDEARIYLYETIFVLLLYCNFTCNFFLYFLSGTMFKQEWTRLTKKLYDKFCLWVSFDIRRQRQTNVTVINLKNIERREKNTG